ncbi:protein NO VEIN domain-containing protein [Bradyrhizobium ivorense]|uniref:protein NO VEIN domain-containing protein n=1 Tax=Bradyrhizobium ivorense TaxID=2511166 RepID=UPI001FCE94AC|nr:DUF3883 domain-containing protein [Bradyrhizobium ivorense]
MSSWPARPGQEDGLARGSRRGALGHHIRSLEPDNGEERLFEIKTTNGHARTRFWLSRNQVETAAHNPAAYGVRRIFRFSNGAEMFNIKPPLECRPVLDAGTSTWPCRGEAPSNPNTSSAALMS